MKITFDKRPRAAIYAQLSEMVYEALEHGHSWHEGNLTDWSVYDLEDDTAHSGYFGVLFKHDDTKQLILAHRGTDSIRSVIEDVRGVVHNGNSPQKQKAFEFTEHAVNALKEEFP